MHAGNGERCTLHCMRCRCHRTSGGSSFLTIASTLKSGCRRCMAKGLRPRNVSVPSRAQAGQTLCPAGFNTAGSMHPRQYLHNDIALSFHASRKWLSARGGAGRQSVLSFKQPLPAQEKASAALHSYLDSRAQREALHVQGFNLTIALLL